MNDKKRRPKTISEFPVRTGTSSYLLTPTPATRPGVILASAAERRNRSNKSAHQSGRNLGAIVNFLEKEPIVESTKPLPPVAAFSLLATEACLQLLEKRPPDQKLVDDIVESCANSACNYPKFEDLLTGSRRYCRGLRVIEASKHQISSLATQMRSIIYSHLHVAPFGILLNKPSEWLAVCVFSPHRLVIFDPQRRDHVPTPHFYVANSIEETVMEVHRCWPLHRHHNVTDYFQTGVVGALQIFVVVRTDVDFFKLPSLTQIEPRSLADRYDEQNVATIKLEQVPSSLISATTSGEIVEPPPYSSFFGDEICNNKNSSSDCSKPSTAAANNCERRTCSSRPISAVSSTSETLFEVGSECAHCKRRFEFVYSLAKCQHELCARCLRDLIMADLLASDCPTHCPICATELSLIDVENMLEPDDFEDYVRLLQIHHIVTLSSWRANGNPRQAATQHQQPRTEKQSLPRLSEFTRQLYRII